MSFITALASLFGGGKKGKEKLPIVHVKKRFDLLGRTGQGSMSKVWRARDRQTGRIVCLKLLDKKKTADFEARFAGLKKPREGVVCASLKHKNIVQTHEYGITTEGEYYLVMELVEGMGLNFLVETHNPMLEGSRVDYMTQLTASIEYMHRQGYLHRDLCPRNVMVTNEGVVKLIDFGLAIPNRPEFCRPGNRTGTTTHLAPEIIRRQATDHRVDLFALGVTAYEVFTFALPWEKATTLQELQNRLAIPGKDPRSHGREMDDATARFLTRAIERDRDRRFQTAAEFREALAELPPS